MDREGGEPFCAGRDMSDAGTRAAANVSPAWLSLRRPDWRVQCCRTVSGARLGRAPRANASRHIRERRSLFSIFHLAGLATRSVMSGIAGIWNLERQQLDSPLGGGRALIFDGRLDNRDELLAQLHGGGVSPESSDSALILEAFRRWNTECFGRLNGEFAVALFDSDRQQLTLARDPVGCRPLYYWTNRKTFVFGSEIKTVLAHPDVPSRPNKDLIADYFVRDRLAYEDFGETFFQDIHAVLPGQRLTVAADSLTSTRFWDFDPEAVVC